MNDALNVCVYVVYFILFFNLMENKLKISCLISHAILLKEPQIHSLSRWSLHKRKKGFVKTGEMAK